MLGFAQYLPCVDEADRSEPCSVLRQNLLWAFAYNMVALPLAVSGWLTPWMAGIGMSASSLFVVFNALRARGEARGMKHEARERFNSISFSSRLTPRA